jgi:hypothetical protein
MRMVESASSAQPKKISWRFRRSCVVNRAEVSGTSQGRVVYISDEDMPVVLFAVARNGA